MRNSSKFFCKLFSCLLIFTLLLTFSNHADAYSITHNHLTKDTEFKPITYKEHEHKLKSSIASSVHSLSEGYSEGIPSTYNTIALNECPKNSLKYWDGQKWSTKTDVVKTEFGLQVLRWESNKWQTKYYYFSDKELRENGFLNAARDEKGNWYFSVLIKSKYYMYEFDQHHALKYKVCISDLSCTKYAGFQILKPNHVILNHYTLSGGTNQDSFENRTYYLKQINLKTGKSVKDYNYASDFSDQFDLSDQTIYMCSRNRSSIYAIDTKSGEMNYIYHIDDCLDLMADGKNNFTQTPYIMRTYKNVLYLLNVNGIYRIDLSTGKYYLLLDTYYECFDTFGLYPIDFMMNQGNVYVLGILSGEKKTTYFYEFNPLKD